ncbi:MAG: ATP synthase subunit I [Deltaproteobacteria bacterium]|nr:ATP synthase subunit I [Deltaproteobacteria bacterium]
MNTTAHIIISFMAGIVLGAVYFWGLWHTLRRLSETAKPFRWMFISYTVRVCFIMTGFYFVMGGRWERLIAAMIGFLVIREILMQRWGGRKAILQ